MGRTSPRIPAFVLLAAAVLSAGDASPAVKVFGALNVFIPSRPDTNRIRVDSSRKVTKVGLGDTCPPKKARVRKLKLQKARKLKGKLFARRLRIKWNRGECLGTTGGVARGASTVDPADHEFRLELVLDNESTNAAGSFSSDDPSLNQPQFAARDEAAGACTTPAQIGSDVNYAAFCKDQLDSALSSFVACTCIALDACDQELRSCLDRCAGRGDCATCGNVMNECAAKFCPEAQPCFDAIRNATKCKGSFRCANGRCVRADHVCDRVNDDCGDGSDETDELCDDEAACCQATRGCPSEAIVEGAGEEFTCICCGEDQSCSADFSQGCAPTSPPP